MTSELNGHKRVAVVGLGLMGSALADALIAGGHDVTVWNRTPSKAERYASAGVKVASTPAEAARASDVLVECVFDHAASREAVMTDDVASALHGKTLIQLTSTTADEMGSVVRWSEANGIALLNGAILVYPDDIRAGDGTVIYGGSRAVFDACHAVVEAMGGRPTLVTEDPVVVGQVATAIYYLIYPTVIGFLHGAALCHNVGVSVETFAHDLILPKLKGREMASMIEQLARASAARRYSDDVQASLDAWNDGLRIVIGDVRSAGVSTALLDTVKDLLDRTAAQGYGDKDLASVFETLVLEGSAAGAE
jgi:3-hydroxyisobutyrate dehydrogenase-like beta-hydroxyacid dehydrogenase